MEIFNIQDIQYPIFKTINIFNIHNARQINCPGSKAMRKWLGTSWYLVAVPALVIPFSSPSFFPCVLVSTKHLSSSTPKNIQTLWYLDKAVALKLKCHCMSLFWRVSVSGQVSLGRQIVPLIRASSTPQSISQTQQDLFWQNSTQRLWGQICLYRSHLTDCCTKFCGWLINAKIDEKICEASCRSGWRDSANLNFSKIKHHSSHQVMSFNSNEWFFCPSKRQRNMMMNNSFFISKLVCFTKFIYLEYNKFGKHFS